MPATITLSLSQAGLTLTNTGKKLGPVIYPLGKYRFGCDQGGSTLNIYSVDSNEILDSVLFSETDQHTGNGGTHASAVNYIAYAGIIGGITASIQSSFSEFMFAGGGVWNFTYKFAAVADTVSVEVLLDFSGGAPASLIFDHDMSGNLLFEIYKTPTTTANGTPLTGFRLNQANPTVSQAVDLYHTPTVTADGTLIYTRTFLGEDNAKITPRGFTWDMKGQPGAVYLIKLTNLSGGAQDITFATVLGQDAEF